VDTLDVKLDEVHEDVRALASYVRNVGVEGVTGTNKEAAKEAKEFYTQQAKAAEAAKKAADAQKSFMERIQQEASASYMRNVGIPGVHGAGGAEEDSGYKPKGFSGETGIMAQLKGAITKQLPESIQAGLAGGLTAGGVMALVDILGTIVGNSKILTTVFQTVAQALGLLLDVVLLPFLPILITGIIWLYQGIMLFYKLWNGIWSSKVIQGVETALTTLGGILAKGFAGILTLSIGAITGTAGAIWSVITWLWEMATKNTAVNLALTIALGPVGILLNWLYTLVTGKQTPTVTLMLQIAGAAVSFLQWLWNTITSGGANLVINLTQGAGNAYSNAVSSAGSWLSGAESMIGNLLHFDNGGVVPGSGAQLAVVHGGETVTKAGQSTGNITINANNYVGSKTELMKVVTDALRQNQYRYNV
jgi:hypothetical protein